MMGHVLLFGAAVSLAACSLVASSPLPHTATVRVTFSSPPHAYSHGHDVLQGPHSTTATQGYFASRGRSLEVVTPLDGLAEPSQEEEVQLVDIDETQSLETLIAKFANNAPRFFDQFPHQRSLLDNIQLRLSQNLPELRVGSIRPGSPFLRA